MVTNTLVKICPEYEFYARVDACLCEVVVGCMGDINVYPNPPLAVCILNRAQGTVLYWGVNQGPAKT